jgi:polyisoprenoid-binding protein YceI
MNQKLLYALALVLSFSFSQAQNLSITPNNGNRGQTLPVIISGQNTSFNAQASGTLSFTQGSFTFSQATMTVLNQNNISAQVNIPSWAPLGVYDLFVSKGSSHYEQNAFLVVPGTNTLLISVNPSGGKPGGTINNTVITIPGASFKTQANGIHSAWLTLNGEMITTVGNIQVINSNTFSADILIPVGTTQGNWDINVYTNDDLMYTKSEAFMISQSFSTGEWGVSLNTFDIYPNPATSDLHLEFDQNVSANIMAKVLDLSGRVVLETEEVDYDKKTVSLDVSQLNTGTYLIQLSYRGEVLNTQKWVKQ